MSVPESGQKRPGAVVTPIDRIRWARDVARLKAEGKTWAEIAKHTGMSVTKCRRLEKMLREQGDPGVPKSSVEWVEMRVDTLRVVMDEASATYMASPADSSNRIGALKLLNDASHEMFLIAVRMGWVPQQLGILSAERRMQEMFRQMYEAAQDPEHRVPTPFMELLKAMAEANLSGPAVIEGRALTA